MQKTGHAQRIIDTLGREFVETWIESFLVDRESGGAASGTLRFYTQKLKLFTDFCQTQEVKYIDQIDANLIRGYLLWLESTGHNPGGRHGCYRALKAFLRWYDLEAEPDNWKNPIKKVKAPKVKLDPLDPVDMDIVNQLVDTCPNTFIGKRDKAILLSLFDTGARAAEFLAIDLKDYSMVTGEILIREGKGGKPRSVFVGKICRRAIRAYLRMRTDDLPALWIWDYHDQMGRLCYDGLRAIVTRRSDLAGIDPPTLHSFRRGFCLSCLRNGMNVYELMALTGHADLQVLKRYVKLTSQDARAAHSRASPVDNGQGIL